jgi:hypothetical protein
MAVRKFVQKYRLYESRPLPRASEGWYLFVVQKRGGRRRGGERRRGGGGRGASERSERAQQAKGAALGKI